MADNRFDEAVDIVARHVATRGWFFDTTRMRFETGKRIEKRVRQLLPAAPTQEEIDAALDYLQRHQPREGTTDE